MMDSWEAWLDKGTGQSIVSTGQPRWRCQSRWQARIIG